MSAEEESIVIKQEELDKLFTWCDNVSVRCGADGWIPSLSELEATVIPEYRRLSNLRRTCDDDATKVALRHKQKKLLMFLMWITETDEGNVPKDVFDYIQTFLKGRLVIVE